MSELMPVVHVTYREGMSSVFESQVAQPMSLVQERGHPVSLAVFSPLGEYLRVSPRRKSRRRLEGIEKELGLRVSRFPSPPSRARGLWDDTVLFKGWLQRRHRNSERVVLHCRGAAAAHLALKAAKGDPKFRIVYDCRGLDAEEFLYCQGYQGSQDAPADIRNEAEARDHSQRRAAKDSHAMICVSQSMKHEVVKRWSVEPEKVNIIPCCTNVEAGVRAIADRDAIRRRLGFEGRFVVAYCGSLISWQMTTESLAIFRLIDSFRGDAHFLAITTQPARMEEAVDEAGVSAAQRTVISVPHAEVPKYLAAADVGLLIRQTSPVNCVASPVKFAEYLSCGLPVILTKNVGDYSELVQREGLGCVLPGLNDEVECQAALRHFVDSYRESGGLSRGRCIAIARRLLGWDGAMEMLCRIYSEFRLNEHSNGARLLER